MKRIFAKGDFEGRVAFITGAASGIGFGLARALAERGALIAITDVRAEAIAEAAHSLSDTGAQIIAMPLDVTDRQAVMDAADIVEKRLDRKSTRLNSSH